MLSVVLLVEVVSLMVLVDDAAGSSNKYCGLTNWVILRDTGCLSKYRLGESRLEQLRNCSLESNYLDINLV